MNFLSSAAIPTEDSMEELVAPTPCRPLHVQRVEHALNLTHFLNEQEKNNTASTTTDDEQSNEDDPTLNPINILNGLVFIN